MMVPGSRRAGVDQLLATAELTGGDIVLHAGDHHRNDPPWRRHAGGFRNHSGFQDLRLDLTEAGLQSRAGPRPPGSTRRRAATSGSRRRRGAGGTARPARRRRRGSPSCRDRPGPRRGRLRRWPLPQAGASRPGLPSIAWWRSRHRAPPAVRRPAPAASRCHAAARCRDCAAAARSSRRARPWPASGRWSACWIWASALATSTFAATSWASTSAILRFAVSSAALCFALSSVNSTSPFLTSAL